MKKNNKLTQQDINDIAASLKATLPIIDINFLEYDIEILQAVLEHMQEQHSNQEAIWVMFDPDALEKADITKLQIEVFQKLIALVIARKEQLKWTKEIKAEIEHNQNFRKENAKLLWL